jgi:hypothetical protein
MQMNIYRLNAVMTRLLRQGYDGVHLELHPGHAGLGAYASCMVTFRRPDGQRREASASS